MKQILASVYSDIYTIYIVERWCTKSSTNKWPKRHQARSCYARAHFCFGQIRFARKVHRTNKVRTKHRSTRL